MLQGIWWDRSFSSVQSLSHVGLFATPWIVTCQTSLSFTVYQSLLKLISIESMMASNISSLVAPSPLARNLSSIRVFSNESALHIKSGQSIGASASASVLPMIISVDFL